MSMGTLPVEVVSMITQRLRDRDFCACVRAARIFHVHTSREYDARASRWRGCATPEDFCRAGNLDALQALYGRGRIADSALGTLAWEAAKEDHAHIIEWLCDIDDSCATAAVDQSGCHGRVRVLAFLIHRYPDIVRKYAAYILDAAVNMGHLDVVSLMHHAGLEEFHGSLMGSAALRGHMNIVEFLCRHRADMPSKNALAYAASIGDMAMVRFLCDHRNDGCSKMALAWAAQNGHVDAMEAVHARYPDVPCTKHALIWATAGCHLNAVVWLHGPERARCRPGIAALAKNRKDGVCVAAWLMANGCQCCADAGQDDQSTIEGWAETSREE